MLFVLVMSVLCMIPVSIVVDAVGLVCRTARSVLSALCIAGASDTTLYVVFTLTSLPFAIF